MKIGTHDLERDVLIVAEIGNNHEGSVDVAERLVREAAACGAGAVKFQTFQTQYFVRPADHARYERLARFELAPDAFRHLHEVARACGLLFLSTPLDLPSVGTLAPLVDAFKIASGDNTFYPLLDAVCATSKPMVISSGVTSLDELEGIAAHVRDRWAALGAAPGLAVLHCVSCYPAPVDELGLRAIPALANALGCTVGYSDHTTGLDASLIAVALGARIIEKHFTLDKQFSDFRDHQLSADPPEFRALVARIRDAHAMLGTGDKVLRPCEAEMRPAIRRSIVAAAPLPAGHRLRPEDVMWVRPAGGIPPGREGELLGRVLARPLATGDQILPEHLQ